MASVETESRMKAGNGRETGVKGGVTGEKRVKIGRTELDLKGRPI